MTTSKEPIADVATNSVGYAPLRGVIDNHRCVAVVGAGLSAPDFPLWNALMGRLIDACDVRPEDIPGEIATDLPKQASFLQRRYREQYVSELNKIFLETQVSEATWTRYHLLARINFCSYVNLNFDCCLRTAMDLRDVARVSVFPTLAPEHLPNREIYHPHGLIDENRLVGTEPIVLTHDEFEDAYHPYQQRLHSLLLALFNDYDVCFIGCNPTEPNVRRLLQICRQIHDSTHGTSDSGRPRHFLLLDDESHMDGLDGTGINVVKYPRGGASFTGLLGVLRGLAKCKDIEHRRPGVPRQIWTQEELKP